MPSTIPSLALVGLVLTCSLAVLGQNKTDTEGSPATQIGKDDHDPCLLKTSCAECVVTKVNTTVGEAGNGTCVWEVTRTGLTCVKSFLPSEGIITSIFTVDGCRNITPPTPAPTPANTTTSTPPPTTPPTNGTTTTTPVTPTTNATTTTPPTTRPTNSTTTTTPIPTTNSTTTPTPSNSTTTAAPPPKPAPAKGGFWAPFIGGIVFAVAVASLAYLIWRFYKVRLDRNYHTFSNPAF